MLQIWISITDSCTVIHLYSWIMHIHQTYMINMKCKYFMGLQKLQSDPCKNGSFLFKNRARHLFFPQLVRRTTIKQYGLVRNRNLLGHDYNILHFSKKKSGRAVYLYIQFLFQDYCVWSTLSHNKSLVFFSRGFSSVHFDVTGTRNTFQGIRKMYNINVLIQNVERSKMYSLYSAHVMSYNCCMFTENHHFDIFGIEWDRNIIMTVISDHLSHALGRWLVYFSFTKLKRRPNGHVTAATAHYYVCRAAALVLEI